MASLVPANNPLSGINMQSALAINPVQQVSVPEAVDRGIDSANRQALDRQNIETNAFNQGVVEEDRAIMNQARTDFQTAMTPEKFTEIVGRFNPEKAAEMRFNAPQVAEEQRIAIVNRYQDVAKQMGSIPEGENQAAHQQALYDQAAQLYGQSFVDQFPGGVNDPTLQAVMAASADTPSTREQLLLGKTELEIEALRRARESDDLDARQAGFEEDQKAAAKMLGFREAVDQIDRAEQYAVENNLWATGLGGQLLRDLGGSSALELGAMINSINANLAFNELQKMRDNSKTGGALGQVSNIELELLKAAISSINPDMSLKQLRISMTAVRRHYKNLEFIATNNPKDGTGEPMLPLEDYGDFFSSNMTVDEYRKDKGLDVNDAAIAGMPGAYRDGAGNPIQKRGDIDLGGGGNAFGSGQSGSAQQSNPEMDALRERFR